jgi:hypothetical protein
MRRPDKPHLRKVFGLWCCETRRPYCWAFGATPEQAYENWRVKPR